MSSFENLSRQDVAERKLFTSGLCQWKWHRLEEKRDGTSGGEQVEAEPIRVAQATTWGIGVMLT
jgi:hypothetical protein